ncbi:hypothetical protein cypCar_00002239 [Cyprinus carpio]|nr:hypothetical protein cypCar_00002239 [Cyprinus carpio]
MQRLLSGLTLSNMESNELLEKRDQIQREILALESTLGADSSIIDLLPSDSSSDESKHDTDSSYVDSDDDELDLPQNVETCLQMNLVYQEVLKEKLAELEQLLNENQQQQKEIEAQISSTSSFSLPGIPPQKQFLGYFMKPYFKDKLTGLGPPANEETKAKLSHGTRPIEELKIKRWDGWQKTLLTNAVAKDTMKRMLQPKLSKLDYLSAKMSRADEEGKEELKKQIDLIEKEIVEISALKDDQLLGNRHDDHDWEKISNIDFEALRQAEDLKRFWQNYLHPSIDKSVWKKDEIDKLKGIVEEYNCCHWDKIAEALGSKSKEHQSKGIKRKRTTVPQKRKRQKVLKSNIKQEMITSSEDENQINNMDSDVESDVPKDLEIPQNREIPGKDYVQPDMKEWIPLNANTVVHSVGTVRTVWVCPPTIEDELDESTTKSVFSRIRSEKSRCPKVMLSFVRNTVLNHFGNLERTYVGLKPTVLQSQTDNEKAMLKVSLSDIKHFLQWKGASVINKEKTTSPINIKKKRPARDMASLINELLKVITPWIGNVILPAPANENTFCKGDIVGMKAADITLPETSVLSFFLKAIQIDIKGCKNVFEIQQKIDIKKPIAQSKPRTAQIVAPSPQIVAPSEVPQIITSSEPLIPLPDIPSDVVSFNPHLIFPEQSSEVDDWMNGKGGIPLPHLELSLPYLPPSAASIKTLTSLLKVKQSLLAAAVNILPDEYQNHKEEEDQVAAIRKMIAERFASNPAYLLLKARFLSCFILPALLATINPSEKCQLPTDNNGDDAEVLYLQKREKRIQPPATRTELNTNENEASAKHFSGIRTKRQRSRC